MLETQIKKMPELDRELPKHNEKEIL